MPERDAALDGFLRRAGWDGAVRTPIAGDASGRRYARLGQGARRAVLMDAPPATCGSQATFVSIARSLRAAGLSAPEIHAFDEAAGLVLMEDLGHRDFTAVAAGERKVLYVAAVEVLAAAQARIDAGPLPRYGPVEMAAAIDPARTHYLGRAGPPSPEWRALRDELRDLLTRYDATPVFIHRDYHAQNLLWLPERDGVARVGVLDFQDAMAGHPLYDLASLLQDARCDVGSDIRDAATDRFAAAVGRDRSWIDAALAVQAAQRHLRILGIFARLSSERGDRAYLAFMPRVWRDLGASLSHPALSGLARRVADLIPPPGPVS